AVLRPADVGVAHHVSRSARNSLHRDGSVTRSSQEKGFTMNEILRATLRKPARTTRSTSGSRGLMATDRYVTPRTLLARPAKSASSARTSPTISSRSTRRRRIGFRSKRSEEHTSELQSPYDLVCRLLLEKKKSY